MNPIYLVFFFIGFGLMSSCHCGNGRDNSSKNDSATNTKAWVPQFIPDTIDVKRTYLQSVTQKATGLTKKVFPAYPTVIVGSQKYYIVEGDILMEKMEIFNYCLKRISRIDTFITRKKQSPQFTVGLLDGSPDTWPTGTVIKYAVANKDFTASEYQQVIALMKQATKDWMGLCNVLFEYLPQFDNMDVTKPMDESLAFFVTRCDTDDGWSAYSFFKHDPLIKHRLLIDKKFFIGTANKAGVLRHELGHILGCRHEHIWRDDNRCRSESIIEDELVARPTTQYDCFSVMHYPCANCSTPQMQFSHFDTIGARKLYGPSIQIR